MTTTTTRRSPVTAAIVIALVIGGLVASACSDSKSSTKSFTKAGITVSDVWARESATATGNGAAYFTLENTSDKVDKLSSASVSSSFAKSAQIHETMMEGSPTTMDSMSPSTTVAGSAGMMAMQEVDSVTIPAGGTVAFEPGGYHVMLIDLAAPLKAGDTFTMSLDFMNAGVVQVTATVRAS
jgi:copper(I)-binding protein